MFRRTVATLLDQANLPIARIADQLGHSDVSMTARPTEASVGHSKYKSYGT
jgi:integrase